MAPDLRYQNENDQSFPTYHSKINQKLPISLKYVVYANLFFVANSWSVIIFFILMQFIFFKPILLIFYLIMVFPLLLLNALVITATGSLLRNLNIGLSIILIFMGYFFIDLIEGLRISSLIGVIIPLEGLYTFVLVLLIISTTMIISQLVLLLFSRSLKIYYLNKHLYIKPLILRNFLALSILCGIPSGLLYIYYFVYLL